MPYNLDQDRGRPQRPAAEPEILLPGQPDPQPDSWRPDPQRPGGRQRAAAGLWTTADLGNGQRIFIAKPGPWTVILALLGVGAVVAIVLLLLVGLLMLWLPIIGAVVAGIVILRLFGGPKRRLR